MDFDLDVRKEVAAICVFFLGGDEESPKKEVGFLGVTDKD
jgi:hypothetical protein